VAIFSAAEIATLAQGDRLDQLYLLTPNVQVGSGSEGPAIRGQDSTGPLQQLGAFLGGTRPRVTLQLDGRPVGYNEYVFAAAPLWDVRQVEIFRSPQTTTQGRNSIAGAIFVETNDPAMRLEGAARVQLGSNAFRQVSAMANAPIADDQLAVRVVGDVRRGRPSSDYLDAIPFASIDRDDFTLMRGKVLAEPTRLPGLRIVITYQHLETQAPQYTTAANPPFEDRTVPRFDRTNGIYTLNVDSLTSRIDLGVRPGLDWFTTVAFGDAVVRRFNQPGLGRNLILSTDLFVESRMVFTAGARSEGVAGIAWIGQTQDQTTDLAGIGLGTGAFHDEQASIGVFGEMTFSLAPNFDFTAGLRYQRDRQERNGATGPLPTGAVISYEETFDAWLPKFVLAFTPVPELTAGVLVQRAYNPGGTTLVFATRLQSDFLEEILWDTEIFLRGTSADGRLTVDANLFFLDMRGNQRSLVVPATLPDGTVIRSMLVANAPRAWSRGMEAAVSFRPRPAFGGRVAIGLLNTRIAETLDPSDPSLGKEFQRSPRFSGSAGIDWQPHPAVTLSAQARGWTRYFSNDFNTPALEINAGGVLDARVAWETGRVTFSAWVRNLLNDFYLTYLFAAVGPAPPLATLGEPREFGVGMEARF